VTRVVDGIYDTVELHTGFFLPDSQVDVICGWLDSYADALEKAWERKGSEGDPAKQKFAKVRSFKRAVEEGRRTSRKVSVESGRED